MPIRILIADDHKIVREGLRSLVGNEEGMTVIAEAADGRTVVELAEKLKPDVIVMDVAMPELNGTEATRRIISGNPGIKVIALSMHSDRRFVVGMLKAGAAGYLLKECAFEELAGAIRTVLDQRIYLSPRLADSVLKDYVRRVPERELQAASVLSGREREVLQLMAEGKATRQIASILNVSIKTIETHRQQIMDKLNIRTIAELTKFAVREGLTSLES